MSDKKPDVESLDFSKITALVSGENQASEEVKKTIPTQGAWIYGKDIKDVTPSEMKHWVSTYLNRELSEHYLDTTNKRMVMIDRVTDLYSVLKYLGIVQAFNKNPQVYIH